ncbi:MAG: FliA/WhiG family RNA polymerase sigma factor [Anaerolineaceae bacterium]|nr:FliA/WhiG family RNA polymerase sigma factor [Anaerolineaceae bacterium]
MALFTEADDKLIHEFCSTRDPRIREDLILLYVPLVHFTLGRLGLNKYRGVEYEDLESQGVLGLIEAVDKYRPDQGAKLSTYASLKIRSKVLDYLRALDWLPRTSRERVKQVQEANRALGNELGRIPSEEEIADYLGMNINTLRKTLVDSSHVIISLDQEEATFDDNQEKSTLHERIKDDNQENPSRKFETKALHHDTIAAIQSLPERDQTVLSLYYFEELTFKEIGQVLDVSESRICQIHGRAMMNLKNFIN